MRSPRLLITVALATVGLVLPAAAHAQTPTCPARSSPRPTPPPGDALQDAPIEVGMKIKPTPERRDHRAALLQAGEQHREPRGPPVVGHRAAPGHRRVRRARPPPVGRKSASPTPVPVTADTTYVASYFSSLGPLRFQPRLLLTAGRPGRAGRACRRCRRRQRRVPLRRGEPFPDRRRGTRPTTGSTPSSRSPRPGTPPRAPRIVSTTPADGATGVPRSSTPSPRRSTRR